MIDVIQSTAAQVVGGAILVVVGGYVVANLHTLRAYVLARINSIKSPAERTLATDVFLALYSVVSVAAAAVVGEATAKGTTPTLDELISVVVQKVQSLVPAGALAQIEKDYKTGNVLAIIEELATAYFQANHSGLLAKGAPAATEAS